MLKKFALGIIVSILGLCAAEVTVTLTPQGHLKLGEKIKMEWRHAPAWRPILLKDGKLVNDGTQTTLSGKCELPEGRGADVRYQLTADGKNDWSYTASLQGIGETRHISLEIKIPAVDPADLEIDGKLYRLSGQKEKENILKWSPVKKNNTFRISSGSESYVITGDFSVSVSDLRFSTHENFYCIHLHVPESAQHRFDMKVRIHGESAAMRPVSIAAIANMGFADTVADDGKGGWSDQGSENDLSCMTKFGKHSFSGIPFEILDPEKNGGKSCMVASKFRKFPRLEAIRFTTAESARYLYLLHAAAWIPKGGEEIGRIVLTLADDKQSTLPVIAGRDCGNWWQPTFSFENGIISWTGDNRSSKVGLYVSAFRLPDKPIRAIEFIPANSSVWMIAGVSFGNLRPQRALENHYTVREGKSWKPIAMYPQFSKGSVLDFSSTLQYSPVKDGALKIDEKGHFVLAKDPSQRVRLHGTNLGQDMTVPTHEESDLLVERLAAEGFNTIRLHQFENRIYDWSKPSTLDFKPEKLDRFFYLWAKLREKGMYLTTDVLSTRIVRPADNIREMSTSGDEGIRKTLTMFSDSAMQNWKDFARKVFTTPNPYTGLTLAEDPALFVINLDNEAALYSTWNAAPQINGLIEELYGKWLDENHLDKSKLLKKRSQEFFAFLKDRQFKIQREQMRFMRDELGVKAAITNLNNEARLNLQPFRNELDLVDGHIYHDHPNYPKGNWNVPISNNQRSAINTGNGSVQANMMIRIPGKPYIVTELQFCYPNKFRSEIAAMAGAYAAMQDWDALYRFAMGHTTKTIRTPGKSGSFDHHYEPIALLTGRILYFLFVRGDVAAPDAPILTYTWNNPVYKDQFDPAFQTLGFYSRIGSAPLGSNLPDTITFTGNWRKELPPDAKKAFEQYEKTGKIVSANGEIELDSPNLRVSVVTPKSELFTFPGGNASGKFMKISHSRDFSTISVHSRDNKPLTRSDDLLLFHLTDATNSETVYLNENTTLMLSNGKLPILAYRGNADIELKTAPGKTWTVEAIGMDGNVLGTIPSVQKNGILSFRADVFGPAGVTMLYRIKSEHVL